MSQRTDVDNVAAVFTEMLRPLPGSENQAEHVDIKLAVELLLR